MKTVKFFAAFAMPLLFSYFNVSAQPAQEDDQKYKALTKKLVIKDSISKKGTVVFSLSNGISYAGKGTESKAGWGLAIRAQFGYEYHGFLFLISAGASAGGTVQYSEEWDWLNSDNNGELILDKHDQFFDLGLRLGGFIKVTNRLYFTAFTGATTVMAKRIYVTSHSGFLSDEVHEVHRKFLKSVFGIPLEAGISYNVLKTMDIGLSVNTNFNPLEDYYGILINLIFRIPN